MVVLEIKFCFTLRNRILRVTAAWGWRYVLITGTVVTDAVDGEDDDYCGHHLRRMLAAAAHNHSSRRLSPQHMEVSCFERRSFSKKTKVLPLATRALIKTSAYVLCGFKPVGFKTGSLDMNWTAPSRPSYTTRSLVARRRVATWPATAKLGWLVLRQFWAYLFQCWRLRNGIQFSSVQFMCCEQALTRTRNHRISPSASHGYAPATYRTVTKLIPDILLQDLMRLKTRSKSFGAFSDIINTARIVWGRSM